MHKILIIDDNETLCRTILKSVTKLGLEAAFETTLQKGLKRTAAESFDVVFLDVKLPDGSGLESIQQLRSSRFPPEVIIMTGYGCEHGAEMAIRSGAWDYIEKHSSFQGIKLSLMRALEYRKQKKGKSSRKVLKRDAIVGKSAALRECLDHLAMAVLCDSPVLITGETGTGKELFARAIHENDPSFTGNFVVIDCAALPDHLVEGILFGHKKGAFTGADRDHEGLVSQADGGTLFLDEIGELPLLVQKKLLRVVQEKRFRPIAGKQEIGCDFRLVSATNRNLAGMVAHGKFREDLFYRIRSMHIDLPPLRERIEDIPLLTRYHIGRKFNSSERKSHVLSPDFLEALSAHDWPGNVRELFNTIDTVLAEAFGEAVLFPKHLPAHIRVSSVKQKLRKKGGGLQSGATIFSPEEEISIQTPMKQYLENLKRRYVIELMQFTREDIPTACRISGLSRGYLYQLLQKYNLR